MRLADGPKYLLEPQIKVERKPLPGIIKANKICMLLTKATTQTIQTQLQIKVVIVQLHRNIIISLQKRRRKISFFTLKVKVVPLLTALRMNLHSSIVRRINCSYA
jgi:hypothetical protein